MSEETSTPVQVQPPDKGHIAKIWKTAGILGAITVLEFIIAFTVATGQLKVWTFILLTLVKAFYIVSEFMHLKYETKVLVWSILVPMMFIVWMLFAFIYEGGAIFDARY